MKEFLSYLKPYRKDATLAALYIEVETVLELVTLLMMASIADAGVVGADRHYILMKGPQMVVFALISLVLGQEAAMFLTRRDQGSGVEIRKAEFGKLQQPSFASTDHFRSSSLVTRLTSDMTTIQNSVATGLRPGFRSPVMMLTAMVASFYVNPKLAMVFFVAAPMLGVLLFLIINHVCPLYGAMQGAIDLVNRIIQENLTAVRVIESYVRGDYEIEKFGEVNTNLQTAAERAFRLAALNVSAMQFVMYSTILCVLWLGDRLVTIGDVKVGELTGFLSYMFQVLSSLMMFSNVFLMTIHALASWKRISGVMEEEIDIREDRALGLKVEQGDVRFDHVYFKYHTGAAEYVLSDISSHISPGQTVGIIGQTGAAKSTLVQLIPRLYEATEGTVYIDGHPIYEYPLKELRDSIAMMLQKNTLFSDTVKDNLRWDKKDAADREIEDACRIACVDEFIDRLERGYDTGLGQGDVNVSDGQKQWLCIARVILKSPRVMILDDSTSAMDTATEAKIREGLAGSMPGATRIIIAQRISSMSHVNQIIILEDGTVNAIGSCETLLTSNRIYQEIYYSQQEEVNL